MLEEIRYAIGDSRVGQLLVAESNKGICAILLGDTSAELKLELQRRFPKAILKESIVKDLEAVLNLLEDPLKHHEFILDERGSDFQKRVWKALREIPSGTIVTYTDIANKIGSPKAVRAVGAACGANPISIVTPCHRVIRKSGNLAGYFWGLERKKWLIAFEQAIKVKGSHVSFV